MFESDTVEMGCNIKSLQITLQFLGNEMKWNEMKTLPVLPFSEHLGTGRRFSSPDLLEGSTQGAQQCSWELSEELVQYTLGVCNISEFVTQ